MTRQLHEFETPQVYVEIKSGVLPPLVRDIFLSERSRRREPLATLPQA